MSVSASSDCLGDTCSLVTMSVQNCNAATPSAELKAAADRSALSKSAPFSRKKPYQHSVVHGYGRFGSMMPHCFFSGTVIFFAHTSTSSHVCGGWFGSSPAFLLRSIWYQSAGRPPLLGTPQRLPSRAEALSAAE